MKKHIMLSRIFCVVLIVLELMPGSAVCVFATAPGERIIEEFSCFDMIPFGNANFGPLITAVLTIVLLLLLTVIFFYDTQNMRNIAAGVCSVAFLSSVSPIIYGVDYMSGISYCISLILLCTAVLLFISARYYEK